MRMMFRDAFLSLFQGAFGSHLRTQIIRSVPADAVVAALQSPDVVAPDLALPKEA